MLSYYPLILYPYNYSHVLTTFPCPHHFMFSSPTGEIDKAMVSRKFEAVIGFATEGLTIDKDSKKLMTEVTHLRSLSFIICTLTNRSTAL